jgi:Leucine-rich repeat (LRR) protein
MLKQLIEIDFSSNNIKKLPDVLKKMTSIQLVIFANNCLTSIDDDTFDILH